MEFCISGFDVKCPFCSQDDDKVIDTRLSEDGTLIRRRRECIRCSQRFTTREIVELKPLKVVKTEGRRKEDFSREKLKRGITLSLRKRPFDEDVIEAMVDDICGQIRNTHEKEVTSREIGNLIMEYLKRLDKVAYIRFASVYRDFRDVEEFFDELKHVMVKKYDGRKQE